MTAGILDGDLDAPGADGAGAATRMTQTVSDRARTARQKNGIQGPAKPGMRDSGQPPYCSGSGLASIAR